MKEKENSMRFVSLIWNGEVVKWTGFFILKLEIETITSKYRLEQYQLERDFESKTF
jgi:hypothetical protein